MASSVGIYEPVSCGTTIVAAEFDGGVVLGADSRTGLDFQIFNRVSDKVSRITDKIYVCRSGSAADTQEITDVVKMSLELHEVRTGRKPEVFDAAAIFRSICYENLEKISASVIVAGWDAKKGGQVYSIDGSGALLREDIATEGSGSSYIFAVLNDGYRPKMQKEECLELVVKAIKHAMHYDSHSGGVVRTMIVTENAEEGRIFCNTNSGEPIQKGI